MQLQVFCVACKTHELISFTIASLAVADYPNSKILPSVVIAQAIVETGWGQTEIMMKHNALFAVKADSSWKGGFYSAKTKEYYKEWTTITALFRAYSSWEDCIADHTKVLSLKRYNGVIGGTDYKSVCKILQNGGYATAPNYASALINIIEENKLYEYDKVTTYNAKAAVDYAKKHWNDTCKISDHAGNDCAHFVAQCLDAGGIVIPDESYKNRFSETTANARTWCPSQASYLNDKVSNIKREFENSDVDPGDIVYATWGDGIQHVYICIAKNKNDATLCAHTNNTCTETISNLRKKHYLWGLVDLVHTGH